MKTRNIVYQDCRGQIQSEHVSMVVIDNFRQFVQHAANSSARNDMTTHMDYFRETECYEPRSDYDGDEDMHIYINHARGNKILRRRYDPGLEGSN